MQRISLRSWLALCALLMAGCQSRAPIGRTTRPRGGCEACHGAPPATGAHLAHAFPVAPEGLVYGDLRVLEDVATDGTRYAFGCGHCHPTDPAAHEADLGDDGLPDVVLTPPEEPVQGDAIKRRNAPTAAYDPATGTCSGVYCHSTGLAAADAPLDYRTTPAWTATGAAPGCDGCHEDPPRYRSAGPASAAPNSHLQVASDGWVWGHFAGMPGPFHPGGSRHGDPAAASAASPITCQTCHYDTVDPAHTAPGGFYYLDTQGTYVVDGATTDAGSVCGSCHGGAGARAPAAGGAVLPLRHVNGRVDVAFDPRPALPAGYATDLPPLATDDPVAPYYVAPFGISLNGWPLAAGAEVRVAKDGSEVLTVSLAGASWDPATRTCSNVGCHLSRQALVDSGRLGAPAPLRWGDDYSPFSPSSCENCHSFL